MTTRTVLRGSKWGIDKLGEMVLSYPFDVEINLDEAREIALEIQNEVNRNLPGSYNWLVMLSEVQAEINESEELTEEKLNEIISNAFEKVINGWKKKYNVDLWYWKTGQGYINSETYEEIEEGYNFDDVVNYYKSEWQEGKNNGDYDDVELKIVDRDGEVIDSVWLFSEE